MDHEDVNESPTSPESDTPMPLPHVEYGSIPLATNLGEGNEPLTVSITTTPSPAESESTSETNDEPVSPFDAIIGEIPSMDVSTLMAATTLMPTEASNTPNGIVRVSEQQPTELPDLTQALGESALPIADADAEVSLPEPPGVSNTAAPRLASTVTYETSYDTDDVAPPVDVAQVHNPKPEVEDLLDSMPTETHPITWPIGRRAERSEPTPESKPEVETETPPLVDDEEPPPGDAPQPTTRARRGRGTKRQKDTRESRVPRDRGAETPTRVRNGAGLRAGLAVGGAVVFSVAVLILPSMLSHPSSHHSATSATTRPTTTSNTSTLTAACQTVGHLVAISLTTQTPAATVESSITTDLTVLESLLHHSPASWTPAVTSALDGMRTFASLLTPVGWRYGALPATDATTVQHAASAYNSGISGLNTDMRACS